MRCSTTKLLVVLSIGAFIGVQALDVVYPTASVVFDQSGAIENRIVWALTPLTNPPPATNFFDIWMRNGIGEIYPDPLNVSIASNLDMTNPNMTYVWPDAAKYVPGPGYQFFLSAPGNASLVYCDSKVFSIGNTTYNASHTTYTGPFVALQPSSTSPASSATEPAMETMTGSAATTSAAAVVLTTTSSAAQAVETTTVTDTFSASPTTPTTVNESSFITSLISASAKPTATPATATSVVLANSKLFSSSSEPVATDLAGPAGQGLNLLPSSGMIVNVRRAGISLVVVATTVFIVA